MKYGESNPIGLSAEMTVEYSSLRRHEGMDERLRDNFLRIGHAYSPCGYSYPLTMHRNDRTRRISYDSSFIEYPAAAIKPPIFQKFDMSK